MKGFAGEIEALLGNSTDCFIQSESGRQGDLSTLAAGLGD